MSDLRALSIAVSTALTDAEAHGATVAAHFLRVQVHELFREARHHPAAGQRCADCDFAPHDPGTRRHQHG